MKFDHSVLTRPRRHEMRETLFRREVFEAQRHGWLGGISLVQPVRLWVVTIFLLAAAVAIGLFLAFGEYTRRSRVTGQLVPDLGLSTVVAPATGVVERLYLREGDDVEAGNALVLVTIPRSTAAGIDAQGSIEAGIDARRESIHAGQESQEQLFAVQANGYRDQLTALRTAHRQALAEIAIRRDQVSLAQETLTRFRQLSRDRFVSELQVRQQEQALLEQQVACKSLERQASGIESQIAQVTQSLEALPSQLAAQHATNSRELTLLDRERIQNAASGELLVKAPVSGLLASRLIEPGQAVQVGQPLLSVLPAGSRLQAQLFVPSRSVGFVEPGDHVLLRYQAFPYQKFGHHRGTVVRISRSALGSDELGAVAGTRQAGEPLYRVLVDIERQSINAYGHQEQLRPGMLLEADILGEHRKLYEWVLEPLYSLSGKL